jgi:hypothetical protein
VEKTGRNWYHIRAHIVMIRIYENVITNMQCDNEWLIDINCSNSGKQGYLISPTLFGIYIDKIEQFLEEEGCIVLTLMGSLLSFSYKLMILLSLQKILKIFRRNLKLSNNFANIINLSLISIKTKIVN